MATLTEPEAAAPPVVARGDAAGGQRAADAPCAGAAAPARSAGSLRSVVAEELIRPVMTNDHVVVGRLFITVSLIFALGVSVVGVLLRLERTDTDGVEVLGGLDSWFQMWALHRVALMLLVLVPMLLGLAMAVVPAQVGADGLAFPRAALGAFWGWLTGSAITVAAVFGGGGWGALDGVRPGEVDAIALTLLGTAMTICSLLLGALVVATTVISLREPGMRLSDAPPFAWSMLVSSVVWLLVLPITLANIMLVYADLRGREPISLGTPEGIGIWSQIDWITEQPAVYAVAVPVLGIAAEMARAAAGGRLRRPGLFTIAIGMFGLLSIGGWHQDYLRDGRDGNDVGAEIVGSDTGTAGAATSSDDAALSDSRYELVYTAFGLAATLPVLAAAAGVRRTLRTASRPEDGESSGSLLSARSMGALAGLTLLAGAVVSGALRVVEPLDLMERATNSGIFNAIVLSSLTAAAAGLWHWSPGIFGSAPPEWLGRASVSLLFIGGLVLAGADVVAGFQGVGDLPTVAASDGGPPDAATEAVAFSGSLVVSVGVLALCAGMLTAFYAQARDVLARGLR